MKNQKNNKVGWKSAAKVGNSTENDETDKNIGVDSPI